MAMVFNRFKYRPGCAIKDVSAQDVGERIRDLQDANGGDFSPGHVVEDARPEESPLHPGFTWDNEAAAEICRLDEARRMIRSIVIVQRDEETGEEIQDVAYVSVADPTERTPAYTSLDSALGNPEWRQRVLDSAKGQMDGWIKRYRRFDELAKYIEAIEQAQAQTEAAEQAAKVRNRGRRQPAAAAARP